MQVVSRETDGVYTWKGDQYEDKVQVDGNAATPDWSYTGTGGGIDDEGYINKFRAFYDDWSAGRTWTFDKKHNRIDASGTMNIWIEDALGYEEYWSNHWCASGLGNRPETGAGFCLSRKT